MKNYTLGLATMGTSAAALFKNGKLIAAVEEERLSRIKNDGNFPHKAISEVLDIEGIKLSDVHSISVYWRPWVLHTRMIGLVKKIILSPGSILGLLNRVTDLFFSKENEDSNVGSWKDLFKLRAILSKVHGPIKADIKFVEHHLTHQVYAESMKDWQHFVSLSYDNSGESDSTVLSIVKNNKREILLKEKWPNSLGHFYSTFTKFLGFKMLEGEYKMMGLAPYGKPIYKDLILKEILNILPKGKYKLNTKVCDYHSALNGRFSKKMCLLFGEPRGPEEKPSEHHINLATSVQAAFEEAQLNLLTYAHSKAPNTNKLVISGGCALNVSANGNILKKEIFKEVIIPPAPHDAGCAIGAALVTLNQEVDIESVRSPYKGRIFLDREIEEVLQSSLKKSLERLSERNLIEKTACLLKEGKLIAWFQGGAEFGPRALGNRSFLADPRRDEIREEMNEKIKKRELFRPFAPSTSAEDSGDFFKINQESPYMNIVCNVKSDKVPAITHIDNTARVHTVTELSNKKYYSLIKRFSDLTGVPVLLNTSFNIQEPIVYSPNDALLTFKQSGVDALVIGSYIILRNDLK